MKLFLASVTKKRMKKKTYMFNNPHSNREILVSKLKWKGLVINWKENWAHVICLTSYLLDISVVRHLCDYWTAWKCSHVWYSIRPTTMMLDILIGRLKSFFLPTSLIPTLYPTHWKSKYFSMFYSDLIIYLYIGVTDNPFHKKHV